ncbi:fungal-specific transcription factor domain-containing protein [Mariannaea sp. PMI_226]|nr:fungal-specific transcription factor domain-containing protein [Mariannaea sp. PMI_226]
MREPQSYSQGPIPRRDTGLAPNTTATGCSPAGNLAPISSRALPTRDEQHSLHVIDDSVAGLSDKHAKHGRPTRQKSRRIPQACDDCRRRKIKCDGKRPCASCAVFNSACTYNCPSRRVKHSQKKDFESLQQRVRVTESLLRKFLPNIDLSDPGTLAQIEQEHLDEPGAASGTETQANTEDTSTSVSAKNLRFLSLVESKGKLDLTDSGEYDFHGVSSGAAFLSCITQNFPELLSYDSRIPFLPRAQLPAASYDSRIPFLPRAQLPAVTLPMYLPACSANSWGQASYDYRRLPQRDQVFALCDYSFNRASCILRVVHVPTFYATLERLYKDCPEKYTGEEQKFVGLLFSVIALGSMYDVDEHDSTNPDHYAVAVDRGYKYYTSARLYLQDITECRDITTLQALVFIIQFLQATGNLSSCYTFVGVALRSALRMGLHRHLPHASMNLIVKETRRRIFHTIRQTDIFLSTTLGLPLLLQEKDIDQPLPTEVNDEYITQDGFLTPPAGMNSFLEAFNAHTKLMQILARIVEQLYPPKGTERSPSNVTYKISCSHIKEIESELQAWSEHLPEAWRPGVGRNTQDTRIKVLLRFAYAYVQMMLYRPFLLYFSYPVPTSEDIDEQCFALATAGVNVCRNIIQIGWEIRKQAVLIGPYWFITYTQFIAILCLLSYVIRYPDKPDSTDLLAEAKLGKNCISGLTQRIEVADKVTAALNSLFEQLPHRLKTRPNSGYDVDLALKPIAGQLQQQSHVAQATEQLSQLRGENSSPCWDTASQTAIPSLIAVDSHYASQQVISPSLEDPFAYPSLAGISMIDDAFSSLKEDTIHVPMFGMRMGPCDHPAVQQHPTDCVGSQSGVPVPLPDTLGSDSLQNAVSRLWSDMESGSLWGMPMSTGLPLFEL